MTNRCKQVLGALLLLGWTTSVTAEVTAVQPDGFVSEHVLVLSVTPDRAFTALTDEIHLWWDATHSYGGQARAFSIEARAGGCFCEDLGVQGSVEHLRVVNVAQGRAITLRGGLGPLQALAVQGAMSFRFEPHDQGSELYYRCVVGGYAPGGLEVLAEPVDLVQLGQLRRLQDYLQLRVEAD